jgi:hypothetical protein
MKFIRLRIVICTEKCKKKNNIINSNRKVLIRYNITQRRFVSTHQDNRDPVDWTEQFFGPV